MREVFRRIADERLDIGRQLAHTLAARTPLRTAYDEIRAADYALTPGRYVGAAAAEEDSEPIDEKIARLTTELTAALDESARLDAVVREQLGRLA